MSPHTMEEIVALVESNKQPRSEFAYIDDSGDPGMVNGSTTFGLGCTLIPLDHWTIRLDLMVQMRRQIRDIYGIRLRDEVKGEWLANVKKHFRDQRLGDGQLRDIYQRHLGMLALVSSGTFAVVVRKDKIVNREINPEEKAWEYLLQRLRMRSDSTGVPIVLVHDQTSRHKELRQHVRRFRRLSWAPGGNVVEAPLIVEDPVSRDSQHSYFVQLADLCAYAASRKVLPARGRGFGICSDKMWDTAGAARLTEVSNTRNDGIVVWP